MASTHPWTASRKLLLRPMRSSVDLREEAVSVYFLSSAATTRPVATERGWYVRIARKRWLPGRRTRARRTVTLLGAALLTVSSWAGASAAGTANPPPLAADEFAKTIDIGGGRKMYIECRGSGSPTVVLVSGLDAAADLWHRPEQDAPKVYLKVGKFTRVCAYDRPGTPYGTGQPSRSDPVPQPTTPRAGVDGLHALLEAADVPGPYVLVGHSYGGLITRLYASTYPDEVVGMVLVDVLSPALRAQMSPTDWETWKVLNARQAKDIAEYPALERLDFDPSLDQVEAVRPIRPMPLAVLTADVPIADAVPKLIDNGELPADTPRDFGAVIDKANTVAQRQLAALVPGAVHVTRTHAGHNIMIDNAPIVSKWIRNVVDAVRDGDASLAARTD
jgi:pimeloyl-ACP methyl ester carboxylesterase